MFYFLRNSFSFIVTFSTLIIVWLLILHFLGKRTFLDPCYEKRVKSIDIITEEISSRKTILKCSSILYQIQLLLESKIRIKNKELELKLFLSDFLFDFRSLRKWRLNWTKKLFSCSTFITLSSKERRAIPCDYVTIVKRQFLLYCVIPLLESMSLP